MSGSNPSVCIVVPILNEARYLREAIDSLLAQNYRPLEITVYDGGSTDGTLDILKSYPLQTIVEPGLGQMASINRGWRHTSAEFVTWMAGDDRYKAGAIRCLVEALQSHPDAGFAYGDVDVIDSNGDFVFHLAPGDVSFRELVFSFCFQQQSAMIRRSALERAGMMDETRRFAADHDLFLRIAQYYSGFYTGFTAADFRVHAGSEDAKNYEKVGDATIDVIDTFFRRPDLTREQRALRCHGVAGSRLVAGGFYCVANPCQRGKALRALCEAFYAEPMSLLTWRGWHLIIRLLLPARMNPNFMRKIKNRWMRFRFIGA